MLSPLSYWHAAAQTPRAATNGEGGRKKGESNTMPVAGTHRVATGLGTMPIRLPNTSREAGESNTIPEGTHRFRNGLGTVPIYLPDYTIVIRQKITAEFRSSKTLTKP